jgi:hypothetical protein
MSVTEETNVAQRLLALCKEYTETIDGVKQEAESVAKRWTEAQSSGAPGEGKEKLKAFAQQEYFALAARSNSLQNAVGELIRALSQRLEHSNAEFEERLELKVRLADLDGRLHQTLGLINALAFLVN